MRGNEIFLEAKHLTKVFTTGTFLHRSKLVAVDDVSFSIPEGKPLILTLAGESGSGKTTTANLILGFIKPTSGEVLYRGKNIWKMSKKEWREYRKEVQAVFQDPYGTFNPVHKVDHVLKTPIKKFKLANSEEEANELISKALEMVGLRAEEILGKYPHQLSGGQRQRIMLARAFLTKPKLIVADEPVSMIDASLRAGILNIMLNMKKSGVSFLYITHDLSTAYYISDEIIIMYLGSIMEMGSSDIVMEEPLHPYTQLLLDSIPIPDPTHRWKEKIKLSAMKLSERNKMRTGCKFYEQCPRRMTQCAKKKPSLINVGKEHWVACFLYE